MAKFTSLAYTYNEMILACGSESGGGVVKEVKGKENYEKVLLFIFMQCDLM